MLAISFAAYDDIIIFTPLLMSLITLFRVSIRAAAVMRAVSRAGVCMRSAQSVAASASRQQEYDRHAAADGHTPYFTPFMFSPPMNAFVAVIYVCFFRRRLFSLCYY